MMLTLQLILSSCFIIIRYHCCNALSTTSPGMMRSRYAGHDRIYHSNYGSSVSVRGRSLFQQSKSSSSQDLLLPLQQSRRRDKRVRPQQLLSHVVGRLKRKIYFSSRRSKHDDDTILSSSSISSSAKQQRRMSRTFYYSTASRMARVKSFANSPLSSTSILQHSSATTTRQRQTTTTSSSQLQMVLSTPDTIIEQASTQKLLDTLLDESVRTQSRQPIMMQFNPKRIWIWRQWRGTVFSETWKSACLNMALATFVVLLYGAYPNIRDLLQGFSILWGQLLSVTTFTLTFFLNQSYGLWRKCYDYSRRLQGRLNDLGMTLAAHATRTKPSSPDIPSTYTPQSRQALELVSRYVRVFNLLTYASFTRSHRPILTPRGMRRLVERGIITPREREILSDAEVPATQRHNAVLVWLMRLFTEGMDAGIFEGGTGFEQQFMEKCHVIRAQYGAIGDELQGRMPLAYAHIVQVLLDVVLWMYPFMALSTGMAWHTGIVGTGLLTIFYQGLFDLAKQFLDPYDNENYGKGDDPLMIDTLIAETNAGSIRWMNSFQQQPWNRQLLNDGEMYDSILPLRGYSVEELAEQEAQEEQERLDREEAIKEKKRKQEEKDRQKAEHLLMGHVANRTSASTFNAAESLNGTAFLTPAGEVLIDRVGGMKSMQTFMEVSNGEVTTSQLLPSSIANSIKEARVEDLDNNITSTTTTETEPNKVLTLADGTLVTPDESLTMNVTETSEDSVSISTDDTIPDPETFSELALLAKDTESTTPSDEDALQPILYDSDEVAWDQLGATPNFDESIAEMEIYKAKLVGKKIPTSSSYQKTLLPTRKARMFDENLEDDDLENEDIFEPMNVEWFDEVRDGKEYRLSQMLADEEWIEENAETDDSVNEPMTYEEFAEKATELISQAKNEILETKEIMSVSPGNEAEYDVSKKESSKSSISSLPVARRMVSDAEPEPLYDQTKLDGISQLWGAPPDVLEFHTTTVDDSEDQTILNDGVDFRNVYSLWGEEGVPGFPTQDEEEKAPASPSMDGFSQLWNEKLSPYNGEDPDEIDQNERSTEDLQAYTGFEWWDEVTEDGKEMRLSQMLADEEYEEIVEEDDEVPMTFEKFAEETVNLIEQAEDERRETEAILSAPPGANYLDEDEELGTSSDNTEEAFADVASSDEFEELLQELSEANDLEEPSQLDWTSILEDATVEADNVDDAIVSDKDIDILAMDDLPEEDEEAEIEDVVEDNNLLPITEVDDDSEPDYDDKLDNSEL